jgi:hypothetical protein
MGMDEVHHLSGWAFKPLVIPAAGDEELARRHQIASVSWEDFLVAGPTSKLKCL